MTTDASVLAAWLNFSALIVESVVFSIYYIRSVKPATLEKKIGSIAYKRCERYRFISGIFMTVASFNYLAFGYYPLPGLPSVLVTFPWSYHISCAGAIAITIPFGYLMCIGMRDAGEETMTPKKDHALYSGGIYEHMRHPQAVGEFPLWFVFAFLAHSPFLVLFSLLYLPVWYYFSIEEERDLVVRYGKAYEEYCKRVGWFPKIKMV